MRRFLAEPEDFVCSEYLGTKKTTCCDCKEANWPRLQRRQLATATKTARRCNEKHWLLQEKKTGYIQGRE